MSEPQPGPSLEAIGILEDSVGIILGAAARSAGLIQSEAVRHAAEVVYETQGNRGPMIVMTWETVRALCRATARHLQQIDEEGSGEL